LDELPLKLYFYNIIPTFPTVLACMYRTGTQRKAN
jgi:hypothetical protein